MKLDDKFEHSVSLFYTILRRIETLLFYNFFFYKQSFLNEGILLSPILWKCVCMCFVVRSACQLHQYARKVGCHYSIYGVKIQLGEGLTHSLLSTFHSLHPMSFQTRAGF